MGDRCCYKNQNARRVVIREEWVTGSGGSSLRTGSPRGCKDIQRGCWAWETLPYPPPPPAPRQHLLTWCSPAFPWAGPGHTLGGHSRLRPPEHHSLKLWCQSLLTSQACLQSAGDAADTEKLDLKLIEF